MLWEVHLFCLILYVIKRFRSDKPRLISPKSHEVRRTEWDLGWNLTRLSLNTTRLKLNTTSVASGIQLQPCGIQTQPREISAKSTEGPRLKATREIWHPNWTRAGEGRLRPRPEFNLDVKSPEWPWAEVQRLILSKSNRLSDLNRLIKYIYQCSFFQICKLELG